MATISAKEVVVTWDGDPSTWADYSRKVRLQWEKTPRHKRYLLGPELASRLTARAWSVTPSLDHRELGKKNGTKYLLRFLRDRLCATAVPDAGARLEDLLIRLRRPLGMTMAQWSNEVLEAYRKVQRALARARRQEQDRRGTSFGTSASTSPKTRSEPQQEPESPARNPWSPLSRTTERARGLHGEDEEEEQPAGHQEGDDQREVREEPRYTEEEWFQWHQQQQRRWRYQEEDQDISSGDDLPWEELEVENVEVLPEEVLGWLLLRRSNLSAANRLSVQASVQNSLNFGAIERALRDQEEELMAADLQRQQGRQGKGRGHGHGRTFWVEEGGEWGLLLQAEDLLEEHGGDVHWVGNQLPHEVYHQAGMDYNTDPEDDIWWCWDQEGWRGYAQDSAGYWLETDGYGTYWAAEEDGWDRDSFTAEQNKELDEAYAIFENKAKTFLQSRQFVKAKGASRGFYPMKMTKGKGKGKKGKKGKHTMSSSSSSTTPAKPMFVAQEDVMMASGSTYSGCFICGDKGHGFRDCPRKTNQTSMGGKGAKKGTYWIESMTPSSLSSIFMVQHDEKEKVMSTDGYGVLDIGATETVTSLEALEILLALRHDLHGGVPDEIRIMPGGRKPFRFGNGEVQHSESFVLLRQQLGERAVYLGLYTLNVSKVPILIGLKTLDKLGAVIDVKGRWMVLSSISPDLKIPLKKSVSGHLLVDLRQDWLSESQPLDLGPDPMSEQIYMVHAAESGVGEENRHQGSTGSHGFVSTHRTAAEAVPTAVHESVEEVEEFQEGEHVEFSQEDQQPLVLMTVGNHGDACPVAQVDQHMRDRVLVALTNPTTTSTGRHGSQDGQEDCSSGRGEVRLVEGNRTSEVRSSLHGGTVPRGACGSSHGQRERERGEQVRQVDGMSPLQLAPQLRSHMGITRRSEEGWSLASRRGTSSRAEAAGQRERGPQGEEDHDGRSGTLIGRATSESSSEESGLCGEGDQQGQSFGQLPQGQRPPGSAKDFDDLNTFNSDSGESRGDEQDTRSKGSQGTRESRRPRVSESRSGSGSSRRRRLGQSVTLGDLASVKEESTDHEAATLQPHDNTFDTTNPCLLTEFKDDDQVEERYIRDKSIASEDDKTMIQENDNYKEDGSFLQSSPSIAGSPPRSGVSGRFNAFNERMEDVRTLDQEVQDFLVAEVEKYQDEVEDIFTTLNLSNRSKPPVVMELCCEADSGITKAVEKMGGIGIRCGLHNGYDLLKKEGFNKAMQTLEVERPDALWVAFPCGPTSSIQELNRLTEEGAYKNDKKVAKSRRLVKRGVMLMMRQIELGGEVLQEWPLGNRAWGFASIREFWRRCMQCDRHYEARVDGCMYGLRYQGELMKKPWLIRSTTKEVWNLHNVCQGNHEHVRCEGGQRTRMSALYPQSMCKRVAHLVRKIHTLKKQPVTFQASAMMATEEPDIDPESLKTETHQELMRLSTELLKLHKKLGHPSRQVFVKMLRDRGAETKILTLASQLHCMDCEEARIPPKRRATTLEGATQIWETVQMDNMEFTVGDVTYHFQVMIDEASSYGVVSFLFKHPVQEGRNVTSAEALESFHRSWIQYFGYPKILKLDKEGAHRGRDVEEWAESHGVELQAVPAEAHEHIGKVERLIGSLKEKLLRHLRSSEQPPQIAAWAMMSAHNGLMKVGGYSPMQWVFGKGFTDSYRFHDDGLDVPFWSSMDHEEKMKKLMENRLEAEHQHRLYVWNEKVKIANNTKMPEGEKFYPGDLVYYRRHQHPSDRRERSHALLDVPRRHVARWFGPARVLALETKVTYDGHVRQPHRIAWVIASGRLKRVTTGQLRHASERERIVAERTSPLATPWTFTDLHMTVNRGEYDEEVEEPLLRSSGPPKRQARVRSASRGRAGQSKRSSTIPMSGPSIPPTRRTMDSYDDSMEQDLLDDFEESSGARVTDVPTTHGTREEEVSLPVPTTPASGSRSRTPPRLEQGPGDFQDEVDRIFDDPHFMPFSAPRTGPLFSNPLFAEARRRHEMEERPHHVLRGEQEEGQDHLWVETVHGGEVNYVEQTSWEDLVFAVTIPTPENEAEWRAIVKEPAKFVAKRVAKGVEVSWAKLSPLQRQAMQEAKGIEIQEWLSSKVCQAAVGEVPKDRLMKMRWVLVFKETDNPDLVKAKARLVVLGFTDPDVGQVNVKSPTLTRRSRQLLLQASTHKGWGLVKGDAKAAFLQGGNTQLRRSIFGMPVEELRVAMGLEKNQAIQFLKAAYGLTVAPREFYMFVDGVLEGLKMERLKTEPCLWRLRGQVRGELRTIGLVGAHVDDFIMVGDETDHRWTNFLDAFFKSMRWSPWETSPMTHCGVHMVQSSDGSWSLTQAEFCSGINQVQRSGKGKDLTEDERHQCRAVLGAAQWRVYQTGPQHAAKLSHLQSVLPRGSSDVVNDINKFVREIHGQRDLGIKIHQLAATSDDDLVIVAWSDASLANRVDLSSTGGMLIGFVHRDMVDKGQRGHVNIISWGSSKLKRVCRSSLSAETQAMAEAEQELMFVRAQWREMMGDDIDLRAPEEVIKRIRGILVTDAKALFDAASNGTIQTSAFSMKEKYTALELLGLVQNMERQGTELRWVNSDAQLADGLTKIQVQDRIRKFLEDDQYWNLVYDENFVAAKKRRLLPRANESPDSDPAPHDQTWLQLLNASQIGACE